MRKRPSISGFTLIEVITAMAVILILTGLVIQISGYVTNRGSRARAQGEMAMLGTAAESYKADVGGYPQDVSGDNRTTDNLRPKEHFIPTANEYEKASKFLYEQLTGDKNSDGKPGEDEIRYLKEFDPKILKTDKDSEGKITNVDYIRDPWGYPYGYSTAAAAVEQKYQSDLKKKGASTPRPRAEEMPGFNSSSYDLWSTGGSRPSTNPSDEEAKELEWAKWVKNW